MREATDEPLQRLYWACRKNLDFPGNIADESHGFVTTLVVLEGLGIDGPYLDGMGAPQKLKRSHNAFETDMQIQMQLSSQANIFSIQAMTARQPSLTVETFAGILPIEYAQEYNCSTVTPFELPNPTQQMDTYEQFAMVGHSASFSPMTTSFENPESGSHAYDHKSTTELLFSVEAILDMSYCTEPVWPTSPHEFCGTLQPDMHPVADHLSHVQDDQSMSKTMRDSFLTPWPDYLPSTLQSVPAE